MKGCFVRGDIADLRDTVGKDANRLDPPDPRFDEQMVPRAPEYARAGYRPVRLTPSERPTR